MKLIVGLGNPGKKHERSRHNVGFMVVDSLAQKLMPNFFEFRRESKFDVEILEAKFKENKLILVKPQTFMNTSGFAVSKIREYYNIEFGDLWVVHDDLDLRLGQLKIIQGRGAGGHHGVESIIEQTGSSDFVRFRVGIGHPVKEGKWEVGDGKLVSQNVMRREVEDYVLEDFSGKDAVEAGKAIKKTVEAIEDALGNGLDKAVNRFNAK